MTEANHTPRPWVYFYKDKYKEWHVGVPIGTGSMKVALFPDGCPTENPEADCRLIAAAPEMLEALKNMVGFCVTQCPEAEMAMDDARKVIAKAEDLL